MYKYHLWLVLSESVDESDRGGLHDKIKQLRELISERVTVYPETPVCQVNYDWVFQCSASHNHKGDADERLKEILEWIAAHLPGSHGLVYWNDDEDEEKRKAESYGIFVIARGKVTESSDSLLGPILGSH